MRIRSSTAVVVFSLLLSVNLAIAQNPTSTQRQDGWSDADQAKLSAGCVDVVVKAARNFHVRATMNIDESRRLPFPEFAATTSARSMCTCLIDRVVSTWTLKAFAERQGTLINELLGETLNGGACAPTGYLAALMPER